jgi:hypothetical protein
VAIKREHIDWTYDGWTAEAIHGVRQRTN